MAETERLRAAGESWPEVKALKNVYSQQTSQNKAKLQKAGGSFAASAAAAAAAGDGLEMDMGELPMLKMGDASIAAPFTSKRPSILSVYDIIRQGRCTLVSRVQKQPDHLSDLSHFQLLVICTLPGGPISFLFLFFSFLFFFFLF
jgi:cation-transporting ATPase 13A1